ncbi:hypothetical protein ACO0LM_01205 [Undibacterium sp. Di26W]|uniref:hypothetical protein n=1 Tax=Undibacterium sp. Di26W TaxID=3413035 RepID=UPI003BF1A022
MTDFALKLQFSKADTASLNQRGYLVAIIKGVAANVNQARLWVTFAPFEQNFVTWNSTCGLFGSPDPVSINAAITAYSSEFPATPGMVYPFQYNTFGTAESSGPANSYSIQNADGRRITFGMLQSVTANGSTYNAQPTSVIAVETNMTLQLEATDIVSVFMFQTTQNDSVVVTNETAALEIDMRNNPQQTIHFDGTQFVVGVLP